MPTAERVLLTSANAAWLPSGGRADVVLAANDAEVPAPTCLVRLLVTGPRGILTVGRADGRGLDLPTLPVGGRAVAQCLHALLLEVIGGVAPTRLLGYVRNVVHDAPDDYPWPWPAAHFVVWHCRLPAGSDPGGVWLAPGEAVSQLGDRHWWPLAGHLPPIPRPRSGSAAE